MHHFIHHCNFFLLKESARWKFAKYQLVQLQNVPQEGLETRSALSLMNICLFLLKTGMPELSNYHFTKWLTWHRKYLVKSHSASVRLSLVLRTLSSNFLKFLSTAARIDCRSLLMNASHDSTDLGVTSCFDGSHNWIHL
jgi:hypothetical protein